MIPLGSTRNSIHSYWNSLCPLCRPIVRTEINESPKRKEPDLWHVGPISITNQRIPLSYRSISCSIRWQHVTARLSITTPILNKPDSQPDEPVISIYAVAFSEWHDCNMVGLDPEQNKEVLLYASRRIRLSCTPYHQLTLPWWMVSKRPRVKAGWRSRKGWLPIYRASPGRSYWGTGIITRASRY